MTIQTVDQTSKDYFYSLNIIHLGLTLGQILFAVVVYFLLASGQRSAGDEQMNETFQLIVPFLIIGGVTGGMLLARNRLESIRAKKDLKEKMIDYRSTLMLKYALWEAPSLVSIIGYLMTGNLFYLGLSAVVIGLFLLNRPTRDRAATELELSPSERAAIENPATVIA
jgi:hypothetical protein